MLIHYWNAPKSFYGPDPNHFQRFSRINLIGAFRNLLRMKTPKFINGGGTKTQLFMYWTTPQSFRNCPWSNTQHDFSWAVAHLNMEWRHLLYDFSSGYKALHLSPSQFTLIQIVVPSLKHHFRDSIKPPVPRSTSGNKDGPFQLEYNQNSVQNSDETLGPPKRGKPSLAVYEAKLT